MSDLPYMPFYWGDFFGKVAHLTGFAQAVYAVLLGRLWLAGGTLPDDDRRMAEMLAIELSTWRRLKPNLVPFLQLGDGWIRQQRVTEDLVRAHEGVQIQRLRTRAAREALAKKRKTKDLTKNNGSVTAAVTADKSKPDTDTSLRAVSGSPLPPPALGAPDTDDRAPSPACVAPSGQTAFLKKFAAYQAGDEHALDPHPDLPDKGVEANPELTAKIRQQLGLDYNHADAQTDTDDNGLLRRPQQSPDPAGPETTPATTGNDQTLPAPTHPGTWHADPGNAGEEGSEMKWNDDDDDSNLFKNLF